MTETPRVFDGHNDVLSRLWTLQDDPVAAFARDEGHINAPACKAGGFAGGFFAIYSPADRTPFDYSPLGEGGGIESLPEPLNGDWALRSAMEQAGIASRLSAAGVLAICTSAADLRDAMQGEKLACILHLEGADCIDPDLLVLDQLHRLGLRSLGPVWSRPNIFGEGVPFAFGIDGDTGAGLTDLGQRLAHRCIDLGVLLDTSHITMKGFWDIAKLGQPIMATHSNAHAVCASARNLTDPQLRAIGETKGIVGLNFEPGFLVPDGARSGSAPISACIAHLDHMISVAGEDHVALGSDFDGARAPDGIDSARDLPALIAEMRRSGFGEDLVEKICFGNWMRFLADNLRG